MEIVVTTDGTIENTKLTVDGKDVTKNDKVISIDFYAFAPYKSQYEGNIPGKVAISYEAVKDDGTIERKSVYSGKDTAARGIGQKIKSTDQVTRAIGQQVDVKTADLVNRIIDHCQKTNIKTRDKETLLSRTIESLTDMASDLGITLEG